LYKKSNNDYRSMSIIVLTFLHFPLNAYLYTKVACYGIAQYFA